MSHGRSLRSIHFIWFLTTWVMVENSSKSIFVLISMLRRVKNIAILLLEIKLKAVECWKFENWVGCCMLEVSIWHRGMQNCQKSLPYIFYLAQEKLLAFTCKFLPKIWPKMASFCLKLITKLTGVGLEIHQEDTLHCMHIWLVVFCIITKKSFMKMVEIRGIDTSESHISQLLFSQKTQFTTYSEFHVGFLVMVHFWPDELLPNWSNSFNQ